MRIIFVSILIFLFYCAAQAQSWEPHYSFRAGQEFILTQRLESDDGQVTVEQIRIHVDSVNQLGTATLHFEEVVDGQLGFDREPVVLASGTEAIPKGIRVYRSTVLDSGVFSIEVTKYGEFFHGVLLQPSKTRLAQLDPKNNLRPSDVRSIDKECSIIVETLIRRLPKKGLLEKGEFVGDTSIHRSQVHLSTVKGGTFDDSLIHTSFVNYHLVDTCTYQAVPCYILEVRKEVKSQYQHTKTASSVDQLYTSTCIMRRSDGIILDEVVEGSISTNSHFRRLITTEEVLRGMRER